MAVGAVSTFNDLTILVFEVADAFMFRAKLAVCFMAGAADFVFFASFVGCWRRLRNGHRVRVGDTPHVNMDDSLCGGRCWFRDRFGCGFSCDGPFLTAQTYRQAHGQADDGGNDGDPTLTPKAGVALQHSRINLHNQTSEGLDRSRETALDEFWSREHRLHRRDSRLHHSVPMQALFDRRRNELVPSQVLGA